MQGKGREDKSGSHIRADIHPAYQLIPSYKKNVPKLKARHLSPLRLLVIIIAGVFLAEVVAMVVVYVLDSLPYVVTTLIDAGIMTVLITPLLFYLSFQPLLRHIQKSQQAEAALVQSLELQERFFDSIDTLIAYMDRDFNFIRVNEAYARADGQNPEYFIGKNHFELYPHAENQAIFQRAVDTGEAYKVYEKAFEYPEHPERGTTYWNWSLLPVRGANGFVEGVVLSLVNVTERVRAEERNRQLSRIVEQTADTVVVTDCDGIIEYVNPAFEQMTGYSIEEAKENTPRVLKSGMHDNQFYQGLWKTILDGEIFQSEIANRKKNGELFYEVKTITPLRDERGDITHFVATGKDITEHKKAEEKLLRAYDELESRVQERTEELQIANSILEEEILERQRAEQAIKESEEKYRSLFSNMSEGFGLHEIILDPDGQPCDYRFLELNDAFEKQTGISREKAQGRTVKEILPDIEPEWVETYGQVAKTGEPVHYINFSVPLGKWFETYCYSPRKNQFAVLFFDVTERVQVEQALRESEARFRAVYESARDAIIVTDPLDGGKVLSVNDAACRMFGYTRDEFIRLDRGTMLDMSDPNLSALLEYRDRFGEGRAELIYRRKDGQRFPGELSSTYFQDKNGERRAVSILRDVSDRKKAEEALRESEKRLNLAQEIAHLGSWELDLPNNQLTWSDEVYRIFGLRPQEFKANYEAFLEAIHPDDRGAVDATYTSSVNEGRDTYEIEHRVIQRVSGDVRIVHEKCEHFRDEIGRIVRSVGMVHDITERKQAEEALRAARDELELRVQERTKELAATNQELQFEIYEREEAERQLRVQTTAMEAAANGIVICHTDGTILWVNPALTRMTGYSELDLIDQPMSIFKSGQQDPDYYLSMWSTIKAGRVWHGEITNRRKDGSLYMEEQTITPVRGENGDISHYIAIKQDITEHKRIEAALELERVRLKNILDTIPDGVYIVNQDYDIEYANPVIEREFGPVNGRKCFAFFHDLVEPCPWCKNGDVFSGASLVGERTYTKNNKSYEIFDAPLTNSDGSVSKLKLLHDITQRKMMELDLERSNLDLQTASMAERKQRQFAEALVAAALVLNKSPELDEVLNMILEQIRQVIPYQYANIGLLEGEVFYDASHQGDADLLGTQFGVMKRYLLADFPLLKNMCQSGLPVLIQNTGREPEWSVIKNFEWCRSFLSAPLVIEKKVIGFVNLFATEAAFFTQEMCDRLVAFAAHAAAAIQNAWLFEQVRASSEHLQSLSRRLVEVQENERLYIARELHDEAGQMLTSLLVDLRLLEKEAYKRESILRIVGEMETSLKAVIENLHRVAMALRPASLDHVGLVAALRQLLETIAEKHSLKVSFDARGFQARLPANMETVLYRIVQESLTNVVRHANASQVDVVLTVRHGKLVVIVEDDGIGFDPEAIRTADHLGLFGMRERAEMIDGNLIIESAPGKGTTIMVEVEYGNTDLGG